jgi:hypothetical protein
MTKLIISALFMFFITSVNSQVSKTDVLQDLEKTQTAPQNNITTAIIKSATRLFKDKDDLTSVILIIPQDSTVIVLGSYETFLQVDFAGNEGYIYAHHAETGRSQGLTGTSDQQAETLQDETESQGTNSVEEQKNSRYDYLESKYGSSMASRLYSGKVWKGMNSQMVKDSWGSPKQIDREISGNIVKEEWFYTSSWLLFQNSTLVDWGPIK